MTDSQVQPRALAPRKLDQQETRQSLNHWKTVFRNYYRRCQYYSIFLLPNTRWNNTLNRGFTQQETGGLKRNPEILAADLEGFLDCAASYLPFDYVADKLRNESRNIQTVWDIIYEIYDAELTTTNYLDYGSMTRETGETYRSFYNRLVGFVRQHLPVDTVQAEGVVSPATGESLTIGLLDAIAVHWLNTIDKRLIQIIKTEFATELKEHRLCEMIKTISKNIDELLAKHSATDQINQISTSSYSTRPNVADQDTVDSMLRRIEKLEFNKRRPARQPARRGRNYNNKNNYQRPQPQNCSHCLFINKQLGASLRTDHASSSCVSKWQ